SLFDEGNGGAGGPTELVANREVAKGRAFAKLETYVGREPHRGETQFGKELGVKGETPFPEVGLLSVDRIGERKRDVGLQTESEEILGSAHEAHTGAEPGISKAGSVGARCRSAHEG